MSRLSVFILLLAGACASAGGANVGVPSAVQRTKWNGFDRLDFTLSERPCLLVVPAKPATGKPWILRTEFFGHEPQTDLALLALGWHVAYMDVKNMYGGPKSIALLGHFYAHLVVNFGLARRVVLEGFSRGGLYAFNFAAAHPTRMAALYLTRPCSTSGAGPGATAPPRNGPNASKPMG
ncbi:MAG: hypothetical protein EXS37_03815 [Opitutus sp.]|nr:hypothetical protein [Opitutus sp.]